jgi:hypothetical protein
MKTTHFSSSPIFTHKLDVAPSATSGSNVLKSVRIVEMGEAKGHGVWLDAEFCQDIVALAQGRRIKCRMGHSQECKESFGTYIGYYDNFQFVENGLNSYVVADLNLSDAAKHSPHGDLSQYVTKMAQECPDMCGNSIEFSAAYIYLKTVNGIAIVDGMVGEENYDVNIHGKTDGKKYVKAKQLFNSDLVDEPAATNSMFETPLIERFLTKLGFATSAKRQVIQFRQILKTIKEMKFDINATTADGVAILIQTDKNAISIGATVVDDTGNPAPDGDYNIATTDSGDMPQVITVVSGAIINIAVQDTAAAMQQDTPATATDNSALAEFSRLLTDLTAKFTAFQTEMKDEIKAIKSAPVTPSVNVPLSQKTAQTKNTYKSPYLDKK